MCDIYRHHTMKLDLESMKNKIKRQITLSNFYKTISSKMLKKIKSKKPRNADNAREKTITKYISKNARAY